MNRLKQLRHIFERRRELGRRFDVAESFEALEESCVPSYCHRNPAVAYSAWWRLFIAEQLASRYGPLGPVLDFGAGTGELSLLLSSEHQYHFVEDDEKLVANLKVLFPSSGRRFIDSLTEDYYGVVFALDSLEHNAEPEGLLEALKACLSPSGVFVLSGPTENSLYRLGRRIAGFDGHYHESDIYHIEGLVSRMFVPLKTTLGPFSLPLFSVSVWKKK